MEHLVFFLYILVTSVLLALMEIQIEGKNGWVAELPTWRYKVNIKHIWEREITGYHVYLMTFILVLLHTIFLFIQWSLKLELKVLSFFLLLMLIEDFLWFVLNPAFGLRKFNRTNVAWHRMWFLYVPSFYWIQAPLGVFLYSISVTL